MVRINIVKPNILTDQHLIAEYNEILMLLGHVKKVPTIKNIPEKYCLGKGHINFFKNKLKYLQKRHEQIKKEMKNRKYKPKISIKLNEYKKELQNNWKPQKNDEKIIKKRIIEKLKKKPEFYTYYGKHKPLSQLIKITRD